MKYFLIVVFLLFTQLFSASIDENYFDEKKVHEYIEQKRNELENVNSSDIEVINKVAFQKLLLNKLSKLLSTPTKADLPDITNIEKEKIDQETFIFYFNTLSSFYIDLEDLKNKKESIRLMLLNIKERLSSLDASAAQEIATSQLEYAYYKYKIADIDSLIKQYEKFNSAAIEKLSIIAKNTQFNKKDIEKKVNEYTELVEKDRKSLSSIKLYVERSLINLLRDVSKSDLSLIDNIKLGDETLDSPKAATYKANLAKLDSATKKLIDAINNKLNYIFLYQFYNFQIDDMDRFKNLEEIIKRDSSELDEHSLRVLHEKEKILSWFIDEHLGYFGAIFYDIELWLGKSKNAIASVISKPLYVSNDKNVTLIDIFWMLIIITVGFGLGRIYKKKIMSLNRKYTSVESVQNLKILANFGYYIIILLFILAGIKKIGLDLSSLSIVVGALTVGIGFGLKEMVSNFVSGIIIMFERTIKIGDFIEINKEMQGSVTDIRMRATTIKTSSNVDIIIPNSKIIQNFMINHTMEDERRKLSIPFSVSYATKHEKVEELILNALEESDLNHLKDENHKPTISISSLGENGVNYNLSVWLHERKAIGPSNFYKLILKTLREADVDVPHQQIDLHMVNK